MHRRRTAEIRRRAEVGRGPVPELAVPTRVAALQHDGPAVDEFVKNTRRGPARMTVRHDQVGPFAVLERAEFVVDAEWPRMIAT